MSRSRTFKTVNKQLSRLANITANDVSVDNTQQLVKRMNITSKSTYVIFDNHKDIDALILYCNKELVSCALWKQNLFVIRTSCILEYRLH